MTDGERMADGKLQDGAANRWEVLSRWHAASRSNAASGRAARRAEFSWRAEGRHWERMGRSDCKVDEARTELDVRRRLESTQPAWRSDGMRNPERQRGEQTAGVVSGWHSGTGKIAGRAHDRHGDPSVRGDGNVCGESIRPANQADGTR
jgi:hypothetical protein